MKPFNFTLLLAICLMAFTYLCTVHAQAAESTTSNLEKSVKLDFFGDVKAQAEKEKRKIVLVFSGLEWCGPCQKFNKQVITNSKFKAFARKNLIIVDVDKKSSGKFSVSIDGKPAKIKKDDVENTATELREKYKYSGVPTAFIIDAKGEILAKQVGCNIEAKDFIKMIESPSK